MRLSDISDRDDTLDRDHPVDRGERVLGTEPLSMTLELRSRPERGLGGHRFAERSDNVCADCGEPWEEWSRLKRCPAANP